MKQIRRLFGRNKKTLFDGVGWILNEDMNSCMICTLEFSFFNSRHHCRACGNIVCGSCSPQFIIIHELSQFGKQRVCNQCYWGQEIVYMSNNRIPKDLNIDFIDEDLITAATYLRLNNENPIKKLLRSSGNDSNLINLNTNTNYNTVEENTWNVFEGSDKIESGSDKTNIKTSPSTEILIYKESDNNITSTIGAQIHSPSTNILNQNRNRPSSARLISTFVPSLKKSENDDKNSQYTDNNKNNLPLTASNNLDTASDTKVRFLNDNDAINHQLNVSCSNLAENSNATSKVSSKVLAFTSNNNRIDTSSSNNIAVVKDLVSNEDDKVIIPKIMNTENKSVLFQANTSSQIIDKDNNNADITNVETSSSDSLKYINMPDYNKNENVIPKMNHNTLTDEISNTSVVNISPNFNTTKIENVSISNTSIIPNPLFVLKTHLCAMFPNHKNEYIGTKIFLNILTTDNIRKVNKTKNQVFYYVLPQLKHSSDNSGSKAYVIDIIINSDHAVQIEDKVVKDAICSQLLEIILVNAKSNLVYSDELNSDESCCKLEMKYTLPLITNNYKSSLHSNEPSEINIPYDLQNEEEITKEINTIVDDNLLHNQKLKQLDSDDDDDVDDDKTSNNYTSRSNSQNNNNNITNTAATLRSSNSSNSSISATAVRASNGSEIQKWNIFIKSTAIILALGMIGKKNPLGIMYKRKLILSSEPSLIYVDPVSMQIKGKIKWDKVIIPRASIFSANCFEILSDKRTYRFYCDNNNQAAEWVMEINNAAKSLVPNFLDNEPDSIYFSP